MNWTVRQRGLIKAVIRYERRMFPYKIGSNWDIDFFNNLFCLAYLNSRCRGCPNTKLNKLLQLDTIEGFSYYHYNCVSNKRYMLNIPPYMRIIITKKNIKLRIQWWKDALKMTEREFKEKYGK